MTSEVLLSIHAFKSALLLLFGIALALSLIFSFGIGWSDFSGLFTETPIWLLLVIIGLTVCNQLLGTLKWRLAAQVLAPDAQMLGFLRMVEITSLGTFLANFLPLPVSMALTRWIWSSKNNRASGFVMRSTMFDQLFDIFMLLAAGVAGLAIIIAGVNTGLAVVILLTILTLCIVFAPVLFHVLARLLDRVSKVFYQNRIIDNVTKALDLARQSPKSASWSQSTLSFLRLQCLLLRVAVIVHFFAPGIDLVQLHLVAPAVILVTLLPITPGGLGLTEWSWGVFLIALGADMESAALCAIAFRVFVVFELIVILGGFGVLRLVQRVGRRK